MPETFKLSVTADYVRENHAIPSKWDVQFMNLPELQLVETTDHELFARFTIERPRDTQDPDAPRDRTHQYVYVPLTELTEFTEGLRDLNPLQAEAVAEAIAPEEISEPEPFIEETGWCGEGCVCFPDPRSDGIATEADLPQILRDLALPEPQEAPEYEPYEVQRQFYLVPLDFIVAIR